ncbi:MAG: hypothetical protein J6D52_09290 [Clostridia bacterium]|nr:hypothetical protein [Clostridia bacterium]
MANSSYRKKKNFFAFKFHKTTRKYFGWF